VWVDDSESQRRLSIQVPDAGGKNQDLLIEN